MRILMIAFVVVVLATSASIFAQGKIEGVWKVTEVTTTGTEGKTRSAPQPSMYVLTKKHYSIIAVTSDSPRAEIADINKLTAEELRSTFVSSFVANAGTYEFQGGKLTMHPMIAKSPNVMKSGTWTKSAVKIDGSSMTMVSESSNNGPSTNPTTFKLTRIE